MVEALGEKDKAPSIPHRLMVKWVRDAWELISDEDIKAATQLKAAYFPGSLTCAKLLDTEYFGEASTDSSDSDSQTSDPPSNPPSPSWTGSDCLPQGVGAPCKPAASLVPSAKPSTTSAAKPAAKPAAGEPSPVAPVEHLQLFKVKYSRQKKW
eukprot:CAMPEP_0174378928 /NCGR_PEP_ID=MMETSP0811_2-20130205/122369_1 /TAXON_ID=73025 ORGANISM="Eutreptiella gymnastica-like, Strain CCMP1594" /NCGR_SAMPLE_ID=MMETSP0811_2 /ASSEMBLY_ACC=CAM_ASM_000667 /LENGTH=152 /DNA_ID=CAMNT_0015531291 /DNA_START=2108 /DNA_END=2564 /DNA_ORIENTATION=-